MDEPEYAGPDRRTESRQTLGMLDELIGWKKKVSPIAAILVFAAAWLGATVASPGQRLTKVEAFVDTLRIDVKELKRQDQITTAQFEEKLDLLLRINCPTITRADLITACRVQGAIR